MKKTQLIPIICLLSAIASLLIILWSKEKTAPEISTTGNNSLISDETSLPTNPASAYCIEQWGTLVLVSLPEWDEYLNCKLPSGEEVEENKFYNSAPYLWKTLEEAETIAKEKRNSLRIIEQDGEALETTADYVPWRINITLTNWIITSAFEE